MAAPQRQSDTPFCIIQHKTKGFLQPTRRAGGVRGSDETRRDETHVEVNSHHSQPADTLCPLTGWMPGGRLGRVATNPFLFLYQRSPAAPEGLGGSTGLGTCPAPVTAPAPAAPCPSPLGPAAAVRPAPAPAPAPRGWPGGVIAAAPPAASDSSRVSLLPDSSVVDGVSGRCSTSCRGRGRGRGSNTSSGVRAGTLEARCSACNRQVQVQVQVPVVSYCITR